MRNILYRERTTSEWCIRSSITQQYGLFSAMLRSHSSLELGSIVSYSSLVPPSLSTVLFKSCRAVECERSQCLQLVGAVECPEEETAGDGAQRSPRRAARGRWRGRRELDHGGRLSPAYGPHSLRSLQFWYISLHDSNSNPRNSTLIHAI